MTEEFKASLVAGLGWKWTSGTVIDDGRVRYAQPLTDADVTARAEAVWHDASAILLDGASRNLDLTALERAVFDDVLRTVFADVKGLLVVNEGGPGRLVVGGADEDAWFGCFGAPDHTVEVPPHSALVLSHRQDGWPVDGARCNLKLAAAGGDVTYSIAILGTLTSGGSSSVSTSSGG